MTYARQGKIQRNKHNQSWANIKKKWGLVAAELSCSLTFFLVANYPMKSCGVFFIMSKSEEGNMKNFKRGVKWQWCMRAAEEGERKEKKKKVESLCEDVGCLRV